MDFIWLFDQILCDFETGSGGGGDEHGVMLSICNLPVVVAQPILLLCWQVEFGFV